MQVPSLALKKSWKWRTVDTMENLDDSRHEKWTAVQTNKETLIKSVE